MLAHLVQDDPDDDVVGFNFYECWPQKVVADMAPAKLSELGTFLSSGHIMNTDVGKEVI